MRSWSSLARRCYSTAHRHVTQTQPKKGDRVVVAMSGGVDSSVTATLLNDKDYDLSAVFMRNWDTRDESGTDKGCEWEKDWEDVQRVCRKLDMPCKMVDLSRQYWLRVFEPCLSMWEKGFTPNPDIWCNKEVKFGALMDHLIDGDCWLATGHYADKSWASPQAPGPGSSESNVSLRPMLVKPRDRAKDQTYYLSAISEENLARAVFPLAPYTKTEIRELAHKADLPTASRPESMGICFVGQKRKFDDFLSQYISPRPGLIQELGTDRVLGRHQGLWDYTIGQNARIPGLAQKAFVARKDLQQNTVYVVGGPDHPALYANGLIASGFQWIWRDSPPPGIESGLQCRAKYGYRTPEVECTLRKDTQGAMHFIFSEPRKHVAPGQVVTVLDGDRILGCGTITDTFQPDARDTR